MELEKSGALLESGTYEGKHSTAAEFISHRVAFFSFVWNALEHQITNVLLLWFESFNEVTLEVYFVKKN